MRADQRASTTSEVASTIKRPRGFLRAKLISSALMLLALPSQVPTHAEVLLPILSLSVTAVPPAAVPLSEPLFPRVEQSQSADAIAIPPRSGATSDVADSDADSDADSESSASFALAWSRAPSIDFSPGGRSSARTVSPALDRRKAARAAGRTAVGSSISAITLALQEPIVRARRRPKEGVGDDGGANPALGDGVPDFNDPVEMTYTFPTFFDEADFELIVPHKYRLELKGTERVVRGRRESIMTYGGNVLLAMSAREVSALSGDVPEGTFDLCVSTFGMRLESEAEGASFLYVLDDQKGMVVHRASTGTREYALNEPCFGKFSVKAMMAKVGVTRMTNGVLMSRPMAPPLLDVIECSWVQTGLIMTMPPLPSAAIKPGKTWTAGQPLLLSLFAVPKSSRCEIMLKRSDPETGIAEVTWSGSARSQPLKPQPGIHHIGEDAVASHEVVGRLQFDVETGRVVESIVRVKSEILHLHSRYPEVHFEMVFRLTPAEGPHADAPEIGTGDAAGDDGDALIGGARTVRRPRVPRDPKQPTGSGGGD
ncbi:MAG: hypothetical protein ACOC0P_05570 [Planctomycetota bacterium]